MTDYFVRKSGDDTNDGQSAGAAFLTIDKAANTVAAGDTVYIGAGTYVETVIMDTSGSAGNVITFSGDPTGVQTGDVGLVILSNIVHAPNQTFPNSILTMDNKTFIAWENVIFYGYSNTSLYSLVHGKTTSHVSLEGIAFTDCIFYLTGYSSPDVFNFDYNQGAVPSTTGLTITRCYFKGSVRIDAQGNAAATVNVKATFDTCIFDAEDAVAASFAVISTNNTYTITGMLWKNCTFRNFNLSFQYIKDIVTQMKVYNCHFHGHSANLITESVCTTDAIFEDYNVFSNASGPSNDIENGGSSVNAPESIQTSIQAHILDMITYKYHGVLGNRVPLEFVELDYDAFGSAHIGHSHPTWSDSTDFYGRPRPLLSPGSSYGGYLDASTQATTDPDSKWSSEASLTDNNDGSYATCSIAGGPFSANSGEIYSGGLTSNLIAGATIDSVKMMVWGYGDANAHTLGYGVYTASLAETLVESTLTNLQTSQKAMVFDIPAPAAGWTVAALESIEVKFWRPTATGTLRVARAQFWVRYINRPDAGAIETNQVASKETTTVFAETASMRFNGAGYHEVLVPVAVQEMTVSIQARYNSDYAGSNPILEVLDIPGVADQNDTMALGANAWEKLSCTFTPTASGFARVRWRSQDTGVGECYFDNLEVS